MDKEPEITRRTNFPGKVRDYIMKKEANEQTARDLVARDLLRQKEESWKEKVKSLSLIDPLTGLYNRRWLLGDENLDPPVKGNLQAIFEFAQRHEHKLTALMLDLDHFKNYNDTFGHPEGDKALKIISELIRNSVRISDYTARYGGEEFFILLPQTDLEGALELAERVRKNVEESQSFKQPMTVSIGIVSYPFNSVNTSSNLLQAADKALYAAKEAGRNRLTVWTEKMGLEMNNISKI